MYGCMCCFDFGCNEVCGYGWCLVIVWVLVIIGLRFVGCLFGVVRWFSLVVRWCLLGSCFRLSLDGLWCTLFVRFCFGFVVR